MRKHKEIGNLSFAKLQRKELGSTAGVKARPNSVHQLEVLPQSSWQKRVAIGQEKGWLKGVMRNRRADGQLAQTTPKCIQ